MRNSIEEPTIVYFSGTGNTACVARELRNAFRKQGIEPHFTSLEEGSASISSGSDFLIVLFPVYCFDAPTPLFEFVETLATHKGLRTAVISVSGGGDMVANRACRVRLIKKLERKGCSVVYETMLTMTSNFATATPLPAAAALLRVLPEKCAALVEDLLAEKKLRTNAPLIDRLGAQLGLLERSRFGQGAFGRHIRAESACNSCGWCARNCPRKNVSLETGIPVFGRRCVMCFRCLYGCPHKALVAGYASFFLIKEGYSFEKILEYTHKHEGKEEMLHLKGFAWKGVREYLGMSKNALT